MSTIVNAVQTVLMWSCTCSPKLGQYPVDLDIIDVLGAAGAVLYSLCCGKLLGYQDVIGGQVFADVKMHMRLCLPCHVQQQPVYLEAMYWAVTCACNDVCSNALHGNLFTLKPLMV